MGRKVKLVPIDRVISKIYRDLGLEDVNEGDLIEWAGEAMEHIDAINLYEEAVAFLEIKNYQAELPVGLHHIIQVARNNKWDNSNEETKTCIPNVIFDCPTEDFKEEEISEEIILNQEANCNKLDNYVFTDCKGKLLGEYDIAYYKPFFDMPLLYKDWRESRVYKNTYTDLRLATHTFFKDENIYNETKSGLDEYQIINGEVIRVSFPEGQIAIAFQKQKIDPNTGYPMIPDEISVIQAITYYITWKYMQRMWYMGKEGYTDKMQYAEKQWIWYCKQAKTKAKLPYGIDEHENLFAIKSHSIPSRQHKYGFFGKLNIAN